MLATLTLFRLHFFVSPILHNELELEPKTIVFLTNSTVLCPFDTRLT